MSDKALNIPQTAAQPPFKVSRASHLVFSVKDLARSRDFYTRVLGLVVTDEDADHVFLKGTEERVHHSLVLQRTEGTPACVRAGFLVHEEADLDRAKAFFESRRLPAEFVQRPHQGRTLHALDASGTPIELTANLGNSERLDQHYEDLRGAGALRMDHYQITVPDPHKAASFYCDIGFRIVDWMTIEGEPFGVFLHSKDSMYDVVFIRRDGPALHHFAYVVQGIAEMIRACDVMGSIGLGDNVEFGPGRHDLGHSYYVYLLDPDGHRVELMPPAIYYGDAQDGPIARELAGVPHVTEAWGLPPRQSWMAHASHFEGADFTRIEKGPEPTLEAYLRMG